jgi:hypothetical protein
MIRLNGGGYTVAGVLAPGIEFPRSAGFWYPLGVEKDVVERRGARFLQAIARVKPGVSHQRVVAEVDALIRRLALQYPEFYSHSQRAVVTPLAKYWTGSSRVQLWILLGASLLLFCASILSSSLLIVSRVLGRATEIATRVALGASTRQILTQLGAEGAFLALVAGSSGLAFAAVLIRILVRWAPQDIPRLNHANLNPASIFFALSGAAIAAVACTQLLNRLRESPGVTSAAAVLVRPLEGTIGWERGYEFDFEQGKNKQATLPKANYEAVTPDYFRTVGTPLLEGRDFNVHDSEDGNPVVIISRNLAQRIRTAGHSPLGQRIRLGGSLGWLTVVGVCGDARYRSVAQEDESIFVPYRQSGAPTPYVVVRGTRSTQELSLLVRRVLASLDPSQAVAKDATLGELIDGNMARNRFNTTLLLWFAVCATALAITGVYGVIAETIAVRQREIAIRMALGAPRRRLMRALVGKTLLFAFAGEAVGLCAVIPIYHWISGLLYGVSPNSPSLLGFVLMLISVACSIATCLPAWNAVDKKSIVL